MPWWGWLITGCVVWVSLVYVGARVWLIRMALKAQKQAMAEINLGPPRAFGPRNIGSPRQAPGDAFGPLHRKQQP